MELIINFFNTFKPQPVILRLGFLNIHWYGLLIVLGILSAYFIVARLSVYYKSQALTEHLRNLSFYLIIFGLIGARVYHLLSEFHYYLKNPLDALKIWQGGLGIGGAIIAGAVVILAYAKKHKLSFLFLADCFAPGLALAQAIGRWGNYFNSELFGLPTNLPWGILIPLSRRPAEFLSAQYFHPCFLYESIWDLLVFFVLIFLSKPGFHKIWFLNLRKKFTAVNFFPRMENSFKQRNSGVVFAFYLILYSFGRFWLEFLRIDPQPILLGLRLGQLMALTGFLVGWGILLRRHYNMITL